MSTYTDRTQAEKAQGLAALVLQYCDTARQLIEQAKQPGFAIDDWAPLAQFVAVDTFRRIGTFKEEVNWREYMEMMTAWAPRAKYDFSFKRVTEAEPLVFLELEERSDNGTVVDVVNSVTVYEFDENRKLRHLDVYLQRAVPGGIDQHSGWGERSAD